MRSSIAGKIAGGNSLPDSVRKAVQLHLMRCLAAEGEGECGVA
jgi:hypothetical protein